jgi:GNAT superfamily N-acetyltransferase
VILVANPSDYRSRLDSLNQPIGHYIIPRAAAGSRSRAPSHTARETTTVEFLSYSTFLARPSLYLEDIFVLPEARGKGAGIALFRAVAHEAVRLSCGRMEWQVLSWNVPSIQFYERLGARHLDGWLPLRLDGQALAQIGDASAKPA